MKTYYLPKKLRPELRKVWGLPIFGKKSKVKEKFLKILKEKNFKKIITVGDYCSLELPSDIKIFDGKIRKKKVKKSLKFSLKCKNQPGTIQKEVWPTLERAIKAKENVFVEGEEDLLVIPSILLSQEGTAIIYGFPKKGVCLIEVNKKVKEKVKELLKQFKVCQ